MNILDTLADCTRQRIARQKEQVSLQEMKAKAETLPKKDFEFEKALSAPGVSMICECKKASPSKGLIAPDFPYVQIAREYEKAGAAAISCLTEPDYFLGSDQYLQEIKAAVNIPVLRKDFTIDPYMIYQARVLDADAVLLIVSLLTEEELKEYKEICDGLGLSALVECHDESEIETAVSIGARIIGVNNRSLKDFTVDTGNAKRLKDCVPDSVLYVSESGIHTRADMQEAQDMNADAVLIGEALMRAKDKQAKANELRGLA